LVGIYRIRRAIKKRGLKMTSQKKKIEALDALEKAGFSLFPLRGKKPIPGSSGWEKTKHKDHALNTLSPDNYGVVLGAGDLVVDVDPRNFKAGDAPLSRLCAAIGGGALNSFTVKTGGGGFHIYFKKAEAVEVVGKLADYPGIDFKSRGGYVVGPGSIHPDTGLEYVVVKGAPGGISNAPDALIKLLQKKELAFDKTKGTKEYKDDTQTKDRFRLYLSDTAPLAVEGESGDATTFKVACRGRDMGLSPAACYTEMESAWNNRCRPPWSPTDLHSKIANAYSYARGGVGSQHPAADFTPIPQAEIRRQEEQKRRAEEAKISWITNKNGEPVKCFHNLLNYFKMPSSGLCKVLGYNEFTGDVEFINPAPWHEGKMPRNGRVNDYDLKLMKAFLVRRHAFEVSTQLIEEAVTVSSHDNKFHPVREYLLSLEWDGVKRADTWLCDYAGVKDTPYTRAVGRKVLCAAVTRILRPGCRFDYAMVLEGEQGIGKSMLCKFLGGEWSGDSPVDPHNKDTVAVLQGKWIVELAEMDVMKRTEASALKAFLTRTHDKVRLAYGRYTTEFPRQCIFIGTINPSADKTYLQDDTGNRRFWPIEMEGLKFSEFKAIRNQLFAEAVELVKKGEILDMREKPLEEEARAEVASRYMNHPWTERIALWLREPLADGKVRHFVSSRDIFVDCLGGLDKQYDKMAMRAIAQIMKGLGWYSTVSKTDAGVSMRGFLPLAASRKLAAAAGAERSESAEAAAAEGLFGKAPAAEELFGKATAAVAEPEGLGDLI
jgi:hypothetical protein